MMGNIYNSNQMQRHAKNLCLSSTSTWDAGRRRPRSRDDDLTGAGLVATGADVTTLVAKGSNRRDGQASVIYHRRRSGVETALR
jgi:hypothetical protein